MNTFRKDSIFKKVLSRKVSHFGVSDFETVIRHEEKMLLHYVVCTMSTGRSIIIEQTYKRNYWNHWHESAV